jgi:hypothetical protein
LLPIYEWLLKDSMTFLAEGNWRTVSRDAEAVCRHCVSNGRRQSRYRLVGDVANAPTRSQPARPLFAPENSKGCRQK